MSEQDGDATSGDLFGAEVERALAGLLDSASTLEVAETLRSRFGPQAGRLAAELHQLRVRSKRRFGDDAPPFLTPGGLEQATHPRLASHRSERIVSQIGQSQVWDATCGIGVDGRALARAGASVVLGDLDRWTLRCALENLRRDGHAPLAVQADAATSPVRADAVLLDPDRRVGGRRSLDPEAWRPSLRDAVRILGRYGAGCLKLAPGIEPELLPELPADWVSVDGSLAEVTLWSGALAAGDPTKRRVIALRTDGAATTFEDVPRRVDAWDPEAAALVPWLAVPDPGLLRSDLLGALAIEQGLRPLAPRLAWLGGEAPPTSPLLGGHRVLGSAVLDRKRVRALLGEHDVGAVTVLKRGHPDPAEVLARRFRGPGSRPGLLAVGRLEKGHRAWLLGPREVRGA